MVGYQKKFSPFSEDYDDKGIRSISFSYEKKKKQNCPPLKKISILGIRIEILKISRENECSNATESCRRDTVWFELNCILLCSQLHKIKHPYSSDIFWISVLLTWSVVIVISAYHTFHDFLRVIQDAYYCSGNYG